MREPAWESLGDFLSVDDFAVSAELRRDGVLLREVAGIYDGPYLKAEIGEYDMDTIQPRLTCAWHQVSDVLRGDVVEIGEQRFDVLTAAQPDGTGLGIVMMAPAVET